MISLLTLDQPPFCQILTSGYKDRERVLEKKELAEQAKQIEKIKSPFFSNTPTVDPEFVTFEKDLDRRLAAAWNRVNHQLKKEENFDEQAESIFKQMVQKYSNSQNPLIKTINSKIREVYCLPNNSAVNVFMDTPLRMRILVRDYAQENLHAYEALEKALAIIYTSTAPELVDAVLRDKGNSSNPANFENFTDTFISIVEVSDNEEMEDPDHGKYDVATQLILIVAKTIIEDGATLNPIEVSEFRKFQEELEIEFEKDLQSGSEIFQQIFKRYSSFKNPFIKKLIQRFARQPSEFFPQEQRKLCQFAVELLTHLVKYQQTNH